MTQERGHPFFLARVRAGAEMRTTTESTADTEMERDPLSAKVIVLVERKLTLELNAGESTNRLHEAQQLTYMKLSSIQTGPLIHSNVKLLKDGLKRFKL